MFLKNHFSVTTNFCRPNRQKANWRPSWVGNVVHVQRRHHQVAQKDSVRLPWPAPGSHYRWPRNIHWPPETEARPTTQANQTTTTDRNQGQRATAEKNVIPQKLCEKVSPKKGPRGITQNGEHEQEEEKVARSVGSTLLRGYTLTKSHLRLC